MLPLQPEEIITPEISPNPNIGTTPKKSAITDSAPKDSTKVATSTPQLNQSPEQKQALNTQTESLELINPKQDSSAMQEVPSFLLSIVPIRTLLELQKKTEYKSSKNAEEPKNYRRRKRGPEPSNSAIYYYRIDLLDETASKYPNAPPADVIDIVQSSWEKLDPKLKEKYYRLASVDQQRYDQEAKQYMPRSEGGTMKRPKRRKHPDAPKHPLSAYLYFLSDCRSKIKKEHPEKSFIDMGSLMGEVWRNLPKEERSIYEKMSENDKKRYRAEKLVFEPTPVLAESGKKRRKHPFAPKHPLSGYLFFVMRNRAEFNKTFPMKSFSEVASLLGDCWRRISNDFKRNYWIAAAADKKRYEEEKQKWHPPIDMESNFFQMPKKPMSAYSFWVQIEREKIVNTNPYIDKKELTRILRDRWNKTSLEEKSLFAEKAEVDRQRYQHEISMLPRQYRPSAGIHKSSRNERIMRVSQEVIGWEPKDVERVMQICGIHNEYAKRFSSFQISGHELVQLSSSKLRGNLGIKDEGSIKRISKIIWILSL